MYHSVAARYRHCGRAMLRTATRYMRRERAGMHSALVAPSPRVHPRVRPHVRHGGRSSRGAGLRQALDARRVHGVTNAPHELEAAVATTHAFTHKCTHQSPTDTYGHADTPHRCTRHHAPVVEQQRVHLVKSVRAPRDAARLVDVREARHRELELARVEVPPGVEEVLRRSRGGSTAHASRCHCTAALTPTPYLRAAAQQSAGELLHHPHTQQPSHPLGITDTAAAKVSSTQRSQRRERPPLQRPSPDSRCTCGSTPPRS